MAPSGGLEFDHARQGGKGGRGAGKGGKGQHAHPQPKETGIISDAGGAVQTRDDRTSNNKQLCTSFLYGSCRKGDACTRSHVSLTAIAAEVAKRRKQRADQSPKGDDEDDDIVVEVEDG